MRLVGRIIEPSREDAVRLTRNEKTSMIVLAYAATVLDDLQADIADRLGMVPDGAEKLKKISEATDALLAELRRTIPVNQRVNLSNTARDYDFRLMPKASPMSTSVIMTKDEFKELVDCARVKCRECTDTNEECEKCGLFQLLTVVLPLDDYDDTMLCPYNLGEWAN